MNLYKYREDARFLEGKEKVDKLSEGLAICITSNNEKSSNYSIKSIAWTLIDLTKYYLKIGYIGEATYFYMLLDSVKYNGSEKLIEEHKGKLRRRIDIKYRTIDKIFKLYEENQIKESLKLLRDLQKSNKLSVINHELYGRGLYAYVKANEEKLSVDQVKHVLRLYLRLKNLRPSRLHDSIIRFASDYATKHEEFDFPLFYSYCIVDESKNPIANSHNIIQIGTKGFYRFKFLKYD